MTFWSGEKLKEELKNCITSPYDADEGIDCAAYTLHVGPEIFVTPDHYESNPNQNTKRSLELNEPFNIPTGMFAFLLTEEEVQVPNNCIAFISMKAKTKFKGLVNVSGFHVDPGYKGRLIFSVYNAGPIPIMLQRGMPLFLMWYAELDRSSQKIKNVKPTLDLSLDIVNPIHGPIFSPQSISESVSEFKKNVIDDIHKIDKKVSSVITIASFLVLMVVGAAGYQIKHLVDELDKITEKYISLNIEKLTPDMKNNDANKLSKTPENNE
jgi:dCTP deaminase